MGVFQVRRSRFLRRALALSATLIFRPSYSAEVASSDTLTLHEVIASVQRDNPEILASRKRWDAAKSRVIQEVTPEKPRLDIERMYAPEGKNVFKDAAERNLAVTQELPFPTTLYLRRSRAVKEADMAEQSYLAKVREVTARARTAYAMLYLSYRSLIIFNENIDIMRRFSRVAESKYAAGRASQLDALKAQVELTKMLNMSVTLDQEKGIAESMLNALLGRDASSPLRPPKEVEMGAPSYKFEELQAMAFAQRPELREASLGKDVADKSLAIARSGFLPDLMLQYRYRNNPTMGNSNDAILGLSVPLWFWKPAAMVKEAKAEKEMADAELQTMKLMTSSDLKSAWLRVETSRRLTETYRSSVLPQAQEALTVAEAGYRSDKGSFLDLLDAQRTLLNFRLEYYQYLADYEQRLAELGRIVGKEL